MKNNNSFFKNTFININGEIVSPDEAKISVLDRGFLYGDSIYEVAYSKNRKLYFFEDHLRRLYTSANLLQMNITYTKDELIKQCLKTLKKSNIDDAYIRIILTRGESELSLDPTMSKENNLVIIVKPKPQHNEDFYKNGINLKVVSVLRNDSRSTNPEAKSGNYLNNVMAITEAKSLGFSDAIMLNNENNITEGSSFNVWLIKNDTVYTPSATAGLLLGITREKIIEICKENEINLIIKDLTVQDINEADEAFITSSTREVMPIGLIDEKKFDLNHNKNTQRLQALFKEFLINRSNGLEY
jgi:branched-chain amino acid aminotransferase